MDLKDREKLEKLLNMLGSDFEGERGNAGVMIKKMADRYNVSIADLCLKSPATPGSRTFTRAEAETYARDAARRYTNGRPWSDGPEPFGSGRWAETERQRREKEDAAAAEAAQRRERYEFHRRREDELREAGRKAAEAAATRKPRVFTNHHFGLLGRLKTIYVEQFHSLPSYTLDFIEQILSTCRADREMTRREMDMAKAIIKEREQQEPLL